MSVRDAEVEPLVVQQEATAGFVPDLVIVFPRPKAKEPGCCSSGPKKFTKKQVANIFDNTLINKEAGEDDAGDIDNDQYEASFSLQKKMDQGEESVDLKDIQDAIILDLVHFLTMENCHTLAFKSCDDDDMFLCVSIGDPSRTGQTCMVVTKAAEEAMIKVQTSLDGDRANEKLGIKQTLKMGEEMYIQFDNEVITALNSIYKFPKLDEACRGGRKNALIKQYPAGLAGTEGSIFRSIDRTRLLMSKIEGFVDLEDLLGLGVISDFYMPHNAVKLEEFRSGKDKNDDLPLYHKPHDAWANFKLCTILNAFRYDPEDVQPIHEIRNYFGERVAFYFVWLSFTGRFVTAMVPFSIVMGILYSVFENKFQLKAIFHLFSAVLICIGSELYIKFWRRCENHYAVLWAMNSGEVKGNPRPSYRGDDVPDPLNQLKETRIYPAWKAKAAYALALFCTFVFIGIVVCVVIFVYYLESQLPFGDYNKSVVSAIFSLQVLIFQLLWDWIADLLVDLANPRTDDDAKDLAVQFLFPFSFVSTYANIIYHAFYIGWGKECLSTNCMETMRPALYGVVVPALLMQLVSMLKPYALYRYQLNDEMKQLSQQSPENSSVDRSFLEAQAKRPYFGTKELNMEMNIMMILFGYFVMFGFAAPGITVAISLTFMMKIRIDAFKLCSVYQRMMPSTSGVSGIGEWNTVLTALAFLGRFSASVIAIFNLEYFNEVADSDAVHQRFGELEDDQMLFFKLCLVFAFKEVIDRLCGFIGGNISNVSSETKLLKAKRERVAALLSAKSTEKRQTEADRRLCRQEEAAALAEKAAKTVEFLQGGDDSKVPLLDNKHEEWTDQMDMDYVPPTEGGSSGDGGLLPDLVICFPRPQRDAQPSCCAAGNTKYTKDDVDSIFDEALVLRDKKSEVQDEEAVALYKMCSQLEQQEEATLLEVQNAIISDMVEFLAKNNCFTMLFRSCDEDEMFLCVSLGDPKKRAQQDRWVRDAAQSAQLRVQTTFNKEFGSKTLGVMQEIGSFEEMYMTFHSGVLTTLSEACRCTLPMDAVSGDQTVVKLYSAGIANTDGSMLRTVDRVRLLMAKVAEFIDLEDAVGEGIFSDYYCPHHNIKLQEFSSGKALVEGSSPSYLKPHEPWSTFQLGILFCAPLRWKFEEVQPIQEIRDYYGERIAFYFAWLAFTARAFVVSVPVCLVAAMVYNFDVTGPVADSYELRVEAIIHVVLSVLACMGATLYKKYWTRWESYYAAKWGVADKDGSDVRRPDYRGDPTPDPLNENKLTKMYPMWKSAVVHGLAVAITVIFIFILICTVTAIYWLDEILPFEPPTNLSVISALFSIQIVIFQLVWDFVSQKLVALANPRTDDEAKDLAVQFLFPFSFVSTYANILFHAFYKRWDTPCTKDNCMETMRPSLYQVVLPALVMQIVSMLKPYALYRWQLYNELKQLRIKRGLPEDAKIYISSLEGQAKRPPFGTAQFNLEINTMFILVGYAVLFGFVAPGITIAIALAFMLKIRIDAFKLCSVYQRVFPARAAVTGIGEWNSVLGGLMSIGRYTACAIPIFNLRYLNIPADQSYMVFIFEGKDAEEMSMYAKIACVFILKELIDLICGVVEYTVSDESTPTKLMKAKRTKMATRLTAKVSKFNRKQRQADVDGSFQEKLTKYNEYLSEKLKQREPGGMVDIPKMNSQHEYWKPGMDIDFAPAFVGKTYFGK